jgi:hypothetical protein
MMFNAFCSVAMLIVRREVKFLMLMSVVGRIGQKIGYGRGGHDGIGGIRLQRLRWGPSRLPTSPLNGITE